MAVPRSPLRGFTLFELLVVLLVFGVLATIAIPTYGEVIARSERFRAERALGTVLDEARVLVLLRGADGFEVADLEAAAADLTAAAVGVTSLTPWTVRTGEFEHSGEPGVIHAGVGDDGAAGLATVLDDGRCVLALGTVAGDDQAWAVAGLGAGCDATAALSSTGAGGPAGPTTTVVSPSAADLQAILDATPDGGVATFPGGTVVVDDHTRLVVPRSMTIDGAGTTISVSGTAMPQASLIDADGLVDGSVLEVRDLVIEGPDTDGWDTNVHNNFGAISWQRSGTWNSTMRIVDVDVTGGYGTGVLRAGGGRFEVTGSTLSGWVHAAAFFESHGGSGSMWLSNTDLVAPSVSKYSSVGLYIHPHLVLEAEFVDTSGWGRYGFYFNGTPPSGGTHVLEDVTAHDNALIQTGSGAETILRRCSETGTAANGGSYIKGALLAEECTWAGTGMLGFLGGVDVERRFVSNTITRTGGTWAAFGNATMGTVSIEDTVFNLSGNANGLKLTNTSTAEVSVASVTINDSSTGVAFRAEGGVIRFIGMAIPASASASAPGVLIAE